VNRAGFVAGCASLLAIPTGLSASGPLTIVCATCSNGDVDLAEQAEDQLSGALLDRGVRVADPTAIEERYRERGRAAIVAFWGGAAMAWESVSWVERVYHARRLFAVQVVVTDNVLPYGAFQVHQIKVRLSYKCYDVETHELVAAGSKSGQARGEDASDATDEALGSAVKELVASAAFRLS
jgi:hypothetical protein